MRTLHHILFDDTADGLLRRSAEACGGLQPLMKRYFLTEGSQRSCFPCEEGAVSYVVQPPLSGGRLALWMVCALPEEGCKLSVDRLKGVTVAREFPGPDMEYVFSAGMTDISSSDSEMQTAALLGEYSSRLEEWSMRLADNCVRTWFFCHDIDNLYAGLVKGRRDYFKTIGLDRDSHYIASTGIAGDSTESGALVIMDALAMKGEFSQRYLYAPTHLNPTHEYGVTFERGVRVDAGSRAFVIISGTASIDNRGAVLHVGDVCAQTDRMMENIGVLLDEGGAGWDDVKYALVYLRNADDYPKVSGMLSKRLGGIPYVVTLAPVCRPDWLIEMECMAEITPKEPSRAGL